MTDETKVTTRGQVRVNEVAGLAAQGCRMLINNRPDGEAPDQPLSDELQAEAQRHGMGYAHIPVVPGQASDADARAFAGAVQESDGPVVAFCRTGGRAAALQKMARQGD